jgi:PAS domain S-box-containing protein
MAEVATFPVPDSQLFRDVFDASPIGIAVENLDGQPLFVNPAFCSFLGFTAEELRRKHCVDFSPAEDAEKDWALFQQLKAGSIDHYQMEKRYFRKDGSLVWGRLSISLLNGRSSPLVLAMVEDITEKKAAEEARYRHAAVVESSDDAIVSGDLDGTIVSWNAGAQKIYGYTESEAIGKHISILVPNDLPGDEEKKILERLKAGGRIEHFETIRVTKTGKKINVSLTISPIKDASGRIVGVSGIARDVTERKQAEQELRESEERLRLAIQAGKMYSFDWDVGTDVVVRSPEHVKVLAAEEPLRFTHQQFVNTIHPDDRPKFLSTIAALTPEKPTADIIYRVPRSAGAFVWLRSSGRAFFDAQGKLRQVIGMVADITDLKAAEEALRASEGRLRLAQQAARIGTFERDVRTGRVTWTAEMESIYGLPPGGFDGTTNTFFEKLIHPADLPKVMDLSETAFKTVQPIEAEWRVIWPDGSVHWIAGRWQVHGDDSGQPSRVLGVNMDVTERKLAEQRLREYERAVENAEEMIAVVDREYRYLIANRQFLKMRSMTQEQVIGHFVYELTERDLFEQTVKSKLDDCFRGSVVRFEVQYNSADLGERDLLMSYYPIEGPMGVDRAACIVQDITDRKRAEQAVGDMARKLIEAQEQERSRISRELHDDINQRLALVAVDLTQLQETLSELGQRRVQQIRERVLEIATDVQALSHELHSARLQYLGVLAGIKSWCKDFAERQKVEIGFRSDVPSPIPYNIGLSLFRVLQEGVHNSVKHSGVKRIEIEIGQKGNAIQLMIRDSGKGFDVESAMHGKGLGLTSMKERVRLINGTISIDSKPLHGTTIHVHVPLMSEHDWERAAG